MYYTYILKSLKNNKFYIGQTNNINNRLEAHNKGYNHSTKNGIPWILIFSKSFENRSEAIKLERKLKNLKSQKRIFLS